MNKRAKRVAMLLGAGGLATMIVPSGTRADSAVRVIHRVDVITVCVTDTYLRVAASNDSEVSVVVSADEIGLGPTASDELRAIFPITIPSHSLRQVTWDLAVPAHHHGVAGTGLLRTFHGTAYSHGWLDENGLNYHSIGGIDLQNGSICRPPNSGASSSGAGPVPSSSSPPTSPVPTTSPPPPTSPIPTTSDTATSHTSTPHTSTPSNSATLPATTSATITQPSTTAPASTQLSTTQPPSASPPASLPATTPPAGSIPAARVPATTSPPTRAPNNDIQVEPVSWSSSSNSHLAALAFDHEESTAFVTQMQVGAPPTWAWVMADLGRAVQLSGIEWLWSAAGANDDVTIRTSPDGATWTTHLQVGGGAAGVWLGTDLTATARYVRFYFHNPNGDPQVGQLGEVRILATPTATGLSDPIIRVPVITGPTMETGDVTVLPPDTGNPPVGTRLTSIKARRSANSAIGSSTLALDSNPNSAWSTAMSVPPWNGWVSFDLGATTPLRTIQWTIAQPDAADSYRVQISANGSTWTTVAVLTNPTGANQWQTLPVEVDARYVRFYFRNPNLDENIGQLSDVRFYAP